MNKNFIFLDDELSYMLVSNCPYNEFVKAFKQLDKEIKENEDDYPFFYQELQDRLAKQFKNIQNRALFFPLLVLEKIKSC